MRRTTSSMSVIGELRSSLRQQGAGRGDLRARRRAAHAADLVEGLDAVGKLITSVQAPTGRWPALGPLIGVAAPAIVNDTARIVLGQPEHGRDLAPLRLALGIGWAGKAPPDHPLTGLAGGLPPLGTPAFFCFSLWRHRRR